MSYSPPPYRPDDYKVSNYAPSRDMYGGELRSQPAYSYYPDDELQQQHFYKWTSPPGVIRILSILIVVMSIGIFACVASTLAWDMDFAGTGMGFPAYGGSGGFGMNQNSANYGYNFGYGGNYTDPRAAKGFLIAMAAFCFICGMIIFVMSVTRTDSARTRKFFLIVIIASAMLGGMTLIATIVYIIGVNPTAQASGTVFYTQIVTICSQYQTPTNTGVFMNMYLYHYCVVEPQEAIAIVMGFMIVVAFALIIFFAVKTRLRITKVGKMNILWEKERFPEEGDPNVEEWVKNVSADPDPSCPVLDYADNINGSVQNYNKVNGVDSYPSPSYRSQPTSEVYPLKTAPQTPPHHNSSSSDTTVKKSDPKRRPPRPKSDRNSCDLDYNTGGESCDELEDDWDSEYPPISTDQQRQDYKREFDSNHQEYKKLQAELDNVTKSIAELDQELDDYPEGSKEYKAAASEYNRLKEEKASTDYRNKKKHCKELKNKLSHIKRMVSDYDANKA